MPGEKVINVVSIEAIVSMTELTVHFDRALFLQNVIAFILANRFQGSKGPVPRAAAAEGDGLGVIKPNRFLVEQPVKQGLAVESEHFPGLDSVGQMVEAVPEVSVLSTGARQLLQHQASAAVFIGKQEKAGGNLLRAFKVVLQTTREIGLFPRHHTLIALSLFR